MRGGAWLTVLRTVLLSHGFLKWSVVQRDIPWKGVYRFLLVEIVISEEI